MLVTKKRITLNNKIKTQHGHDIDTSYRTTLFSFNTDIFKENIAACNSPCFWWQLLTVWSHVCLTCADIITNIYMVGELTAIKTDKLGGETV